MRRNRRDRAERLYVGLIQGPQNGKVHSRAVRAFLFVLKQFSHAYRAVVQCRSFLYAKRILRHQTLGCQVISVGNLTVGGTGKTPVVEVFAHELQKAGRKVAVLSRGYKKVEPAFARRMVDRVLLQDLRRPPRVVSDGKRLLLDSAMSGDEPFMLASNLPNVAVLVDRNRVKSGRFAIRELGCDTLILDDGFQYLELKHRVEIVLVDSRNPFGNEHVLPRGLLREPIKNIRKAHFIFVTKCDGGDRSALLSRLRALNPRAEIIECKHSAQYLQNVASSEHKPLEYLDGKRVSVVSGIASPGGFENELRDRGAEIIDNNRFADHHRYTQQEILDIINTARRLGADAIITTEKDAVRFPKLGRCDVPVYFLRVKIEMLTGEEDFHECIARICFKNEQEAAAGSAS